MTFLSLRPATACLVHFPDGGQSRPTETCQMHQIENDQSAKPVAIAPIHHTGDEYRINGTSCSDWGMM